MMLIDRATIYFLQLSECEEYKNLTAVFEYLRGHSMNSKSKIFKDYVCNSSAAPMILGGTEAKHGEFPHMAAIGLTADGRISNK